MSILDRYIVSELIGPFLFGISAFSTVFIGGGTLWRIAQYISKYGANGGVAMKLFFYSLPAVIVITIPMAMLLAALLCFGRLSRCGEITAMKSGGRSFVRLAMPVFIVAVLVSIFTALFKETVVPASTAAYNYLVQYEIEGNTRPKDQKHVVILESNPEITRLIYSPQFDQQSNSMYPVTIQEYEGNRLVRLEQAAKAVWCDRRWVMISGVIHDLSSANSITVNFKQQALPVNTPPTVIPLDQKKPEEMTVPELNLQIAALRSKHAATGTLEVELYQRLAIPAACLVFAMLGAPLGLESQRSTSSTGLAISILVIFLYYVIMTYTTVLGQSGVLKPIWAAWLPNIIGAAAASILIFRRGD